VSVASLDIRLPIGALFTALGALVGGYGLVAGRAAEGAAASLSVNIDLWWGLVMLVFGVLLLASALRTRRPASAHPAVDVPEGRATEAREHRLGLEE
jgi:membrane protein implicated in regulation of membrane protease activity